MSKTIAFNVWTKSPNSISVYIEDFADQADSFSLLFVRRQSCQEVTIEIDETKPCRNQIKFCFSVDCELLQGRYDLTLTNTTKDEIVFSGPANVYDIPSDCIKNPL